jgi:hypothetical protein
VAALDAELVYYHIDKFEHTLRIWVVSGGDESNHEGEGSSGGAPFFVEQSLPSEPSLESLCEAVRAPSDELTPRGRSIAPAAPPSRTSSSVADSKRKGAAEDASSRSSTVRGSDAGVGGGSSISLSDALASLHGLLIAPIAHKLRRGRRVVFFPHDNLALVPFGVLHGVDRTEEMQTWSVSQVVDWVGGAQLSAEHTAAVQSAFEAEEVALDGSILSSTTGRRRCWFKKC